MPVPSPYAKLLSHVPVLENTLEVLGTRAHYWEYGDSDAATTLVLVHGFRGDHHGLEPVIAHLRGVRVIAPDLPGFGASERFPDREHSIASYAQWLSAFVGAIAPDGDAVIVGHSFGSIVVSAAVAGGLPCARVVLINPIAAPALRAPAASSPALPSSTISWVPCCPRSSASACCAIG